MNKFLGFKIAYFLFLTLNNTHSATVNRFGLFHKLPGILLPSHFLLKQINGIDEKRCLQLCMFDKKCSSVAYGSKRCIQYSTDPRVELNESSIVRTSSSDLTLWVISDGFDVPCFVGNIEAYRPSDFENCGLEQSMTDSKCSDWLDIELSYVNPCGSNYANILKSRTRARNCTRPIFGGKKCTGGRFDEQTKYPVPYHAVFEYAQAESYCNQINKTLFTALFWYSENQIDEFLQPAKRFWTGFRKPAAAMIGNDTKYSDQTGTQYITSMCGGLLWGG